MFPNLVERVSTVHLYACSGDISFCDSEDNVITQPFVNVPLEASLCCPMLVVGLFDHTSPHDGAVCIGDVMVCALLQIQMTKG